MNPALFFDPQVNGYGGVDFQQDDLQPEDLRRAVQAWHRDGGHQFFLTLITDRWDTMLSRLHRARTLCQAHSDLRQTIVGWHLEGPFLSPEPGFRGAHHPDLMRDPTPDHLRQLRDVVEGDRTLLTLAPERIGAVGAIALARSYGFHISLGHTNASTEQLRAAVAAGATGFTHLANGCPQSLDRHDNILWRVLDLPELIIGLIADGIHVSPPLFRLLHRVLPPQRLYYTTDAMAAAGAPPGDYPLGTLRLHVGEDRVVRLPGSPHFAGSALQPREIPTRVAAILDPLADSLSAWPFQTARTWLNPALTPPRPPGIVAPRE